MMNKELITIKEAHELTGMSESTLRYWAKNYINNKKIYKHKTYISKDELMYHYNNKDNSKNPYAYLSIPKKDESFKPAFTLEQGKISFPKCQLMVGDKGSIWNNSRNRLYHDGAPDTNGHLQIALKNRFFYRHRLVAMVWCDNAKFKQNIHHIDGNPINNAADNLLWVTAEEHRKLHGVKDEGDIQKYYKMINGIKRENTWKGERQYVFINDEVSDCNNITVYCVDYEGFCMLLKHKSILDVAAEGHMLIERAITIDNQKGKIKEDNDNDYGN